MRVSIRKLTMMALLTAVALIVFVIESQIPIPVPVPGVKLGLANAVTLFALFYSGGKERGKNSLTVVNIFMILVCRIVLGALLTGRIVALIYSFSGGLLSFAVQAAMKQFISNKQIWACSAVSSVFHNIGQIIAAILVTGTPSIAAYLPVLIISGVITGILTGLVAQFCVMRINL